MTRAPPAVRGVGLHELVTGVGLREAATLPAGGTLAVTLPAGRRRKRPRREREGAEVALLKPPDREELLPLPLLKPLLLL